MDPTALHVMQQLASEELAATHERGDKPHYREIADVAVRRYVDACRVPVWLSAEERATYAHELVRRMLETDARR